MSERPPTGSVAEVAPGVIRIVAPNPSAMTATGTCTYVVGDGAGRCVVDPGPDDPAHRAAIEAALLGGVAEAVLVTHPHLDHSAGAPPLAATLGAPIWAFGPPERGRSAAMAALPHPGGGEGVDQAFRPDRNLDDDAVVEGRGWSLAAVWTPGHMASHLSFHWTERGLLFTGDVLMGWASTLISPPDGDVTQFLASLDRIEALGADRLLPGHGAPIDDPTGRCRAMRRHREDREAAILRALDGAATIPALVAAVYADTAPAMHAMAARNVLAHLVRLVELGAVQADRLAPDGRFTRA